MSADQSLRDLARAAVTRCANAYLRMGATVMIAAMLDVFIHMSWAWIWAALCVAVQAVEFWVARPLIVQPMRPLTSGRRALILVWPFLTSATFGAMALPLFASSARFAPTLGGMLLAGALLHVIVVNGSMRAATLWAAAPHVIYLLVVPFVARAANPGAPLANALWIGALLLVIAVALASRTLHAALKAEADAKDEAERRRHEAEEAVAAKSAFVAMISHELRTPISAILAGAARLHSEVPEASAKVHAQLIADAGGLMRVLLNDLLDFSRLEAGRMGVEKAPFNLRQTLSDTLRLWRPDVAKKGLRLRIEGAASLPRWVAGDAMRLRQVLNNLLSNAIKFTDQGAITVRFAHRCEQGAHQLSIEVSDTGPGIPEAYLPRLFTPFDQLSSAVVRQHGGSGLGLVISRELARLMGGDLTAASPAGGGAALTLTLQLDPAQPPETPDEGRSIAGTRVLVVDDHAVNRRAIALILEPFGVKTTLVDSGEEALRRLETEAFDAILMDVYMPGLDGRETTRVLRATTGPNRRTPVIAVTASDTPKDWDACQAAGMNGHVAKPIDPLELYEALLLALPDPEPASA